MVREQVREAIIRPNRLLSDESTERLLDMLQYVPGIKNVVFQGHNCPPREINVGGQPFMISVMINGVYLEVEDEDVVADIKAVCKEAITCSCNVEYREYLRPNRVSERATKVEKNIGTLGGKESEEE